jgi:hypothetical protein
MADFEGDVFLESVDIAVYCGIVPSCRDDEFDTHIAIVGRTQHVIAIVIEPCQFLPVFRVVQQLRVA